MLKSSRIETDYENITAVCPRSECAKVNIFNRRSDLKDLNPISNKIVHCHFCHVMFYINGDNINENFEKMIFDCYKLMEDKKYMYSITNLCQSFEMFFSHAIQIKLVLEPYMNRVFKDLEDINIFNKKLIHEIEEFTFPYMKYVFCDLYLNDYEFTNRTQISEYIINIKKTKDIYRRENHTINLIHASTFSEKLKEIFFQLESLTIHKIRNNVVHKVGYRPSFEEVNSQLTYAREIILHLKYFLNIHPKQFYLNQHVDILENNDPDPLYEIAKQMVITKKSGSASMIQRELRIGYSRAMRLLRQFEKDGIVGPRAGSKPREVLVIN